MAESAAPSPGRIFISYRREETAWTAGWLYERLADRYGRGQVFKDIDSIRLGDDFVEMVTSAIASCDVLLALVGDRWLTITDEDGRRRLDDPDDFVRLEIEAALTRNVRVIPVLVDARMPRANELPPSLAKLVRRQALELSPARFDFDTSRLLNVLDTTLAEMRSAQDAEPDRLAPVARDQPRPHEQDLSLIEEPSEAPTQRKDRATAPTPLLASAPGAPAQPRQARRWLLLAIIAVSGAVAVALAFAAFRPSPGLPAASRSADPSSLPVLEWRSIDPLSATVDSPGVVALDGELWVVGGLLQRAPDEPHPASNTVQIYDPEKDQWRPGPELDVSLDHAAVATDGDTLYVVGGQTDVDGEKVVHDGAYVLAEDHQTWQPLEPLPKPRVAGAAAWDGERLVFAGGLTAPEPEGTPAADVWILEGSDWHPLGQLQQAREHLTAATDGHGKVWFLGGKVGANPSGSVDIIMGKSISAGPNVSSVIAPAAVWHRDMGVCLLGGRLERRSGTNAATTNAATCLEKKPELPPWPLLPEARAGAGAAILDGDVYFVGGYDDGNIFSDHVQMLDLG